jgi:hypothetical protein
MPYIRKDIFFLFLKYPFFRFFLPITAALSFLSSDILPTNVLVDMTLLLHNRLLTHAVLYSY